MEAAAAAGVQGAGTLAVAAKATAAAATVMARVALAERAKAAWGTEVAASAAAERRYKIRGFLRKTSCMTELNIWKCLNKKMTLLRRSGSKGRLRDLCQ